MIIGIGVDVIEISRIQKAMEKSARFALKILTEDELNIFHTLKYKKQVEYLAGRFAAKEALSKAYGTGIGQLSFQDMTVLNELNGKPVMTCSKINDCIHISLSHSDTVVIAYVILERRLK